METYHDDLEDVVASCPSPSNIKLKKTELDDFYSFLYGDQAMGRSPPPSLGVVMTAERKVWRQVALMMSKDETVTICSALKSIQDKSRFWAVEIDDSVSAARSRATRAMASTKFDKPGKGKGVRWGKGKSQGTKTMGVGITGNKETRLLRIPRQMHVRGPMSRWRTWNGPRFMLSIGVKGVAVAPTTVQSFCPPAKCVKRPGPLVKKQPLPAKSQQRARGWQGCTREKGIPSASGLHPGHLRHHAGP